MVCEPSLTVHMIAGFNRAAEGIFLDHRVKCNVSVTFADRCSPFKGVPPRALVRVMQSQGSDRAGATEWLFLFDGDFGGLNYRKDGVALFEIHSLH